MVFEKTGPWTSVCRITGAVVSKPFRSELEVVKGTRSSFICNKDEIMRKGSEVIKPFLCSTQLSMKFIMFINVKMPTIIAGFAQACKVLE